MPARTAPPNPQGSPHQERRRPGRAWLWALGLIAAVVLIEAGAMIWRPASSGAQPQVAAARATRAALPVQQVGTIEALPPGPVDHIDVVYFHATQRCPTCLEIERLTRHTVEAYYASETASGAIELVVANVQESSNAALAGQYGAATSDLYLGIFKNGVHYTYLHSDAWLLAHDEPAFIASLRARLDALRASR